MSWIENQRCGQRGQTSNSIGERVFNWLNTGRPGFGLKATNATISSLLNTQALL